MMDLESLKSVKFTRLEVTLELGGDFPIDWNFSSSIRGIFGRVLKNNTCLQRDIECDKCSFNNCIYFLLFERSGHSFENFRPYIIYHKDNSKRSVILEFTFFNQITDYITILIFNILRMAEKKMQLIKNRYPINIIRITDGNGDEVFSKIKERISTPSIEHFSIPKDHPTEFQLSFITPIRLKYKRNLMRKFIWEAFYRNLYHRALYYDVATKKWTP